MHDFLNNYLPIRMIQRYKDYFSQKKCDGELSYKTGWAESISATYSVLTRDFEKLLDERSTKDDLGKFQNPTDNEIRRMAIERMVENMIPEVVGIRLKAGSQRLIVLVSKYIINNGFPAKFYGKNVIQQKIEYIEDHRIDY